MIILNSSYSLEIVLSGNVATNQLPMFCNYTDVSYGQSTVMVSDGQTNNTTPVVIVPGPANGLPPVTRHISFLSVYNADTASATVTIKTNDGRVIMTVTLSSGDNLIYDSEFNVINSTGFTKTVTP